KSNTLLNESPGAGYLERRWPEVFKANGAWPIKSLRQAFLDGSLERLFNPREDLERKVPVFVAPGDFGLASVDQPGSRYQCVWFKEAISPDEVAFDADVYLPSKERKREGDPYGFCGRRNIRRRRCSGSRRKYAGHQKRRQS